MRFPTTYIRRSACYATVEQEVPAPYFRKTFTLDTVAPDGELLIGTPGFYRLFLNGTELTRGLLSPYISNPDHYVYFDRYDPVPYLRQGENVLAVLLGNGMQNAYGGYVWAFDQAPWRGAPSFALSLNLGDGTVLTSDESWRTAASPLLADDLRQGEVYDARLEIPGWNLTGFDDSAWDCAERAPVPRGEAKLSAVPPITVREERAPVAVWQEGESWIYDFGVNQSGICRLNFAGEPGRTLTLSFGEILDSAGHFDAENLHFHRPGKPQYAQRVVYTAGGGQRTYMPSFCYFGYRYVKVEGLLPAEAVPGLLTYVVMNTHLRPHASFSTSDPTLAKLFDMTVCSDLSNFFHFPNDCPHREKNGWTADAALSAEQMLLLFTPEENYRQWLENIRAAMDRRGALPGIVPTGGWGFAWGNGPAWDCVLFELPYRLWQLRGDTAVISDNAHAMLRYLAYINTRRTPDGLVAIGLGDWCAPGNTPESPLAFTDTVMCMNMSGQARQMFAAVGLEREAAYAAANERSYREAIRAHLIDYSTMTAAGNCMTSQAMALYYGVFDEAERPAAERELLRIIAQKQEATYVGVLGARVLFRQLCDMGQAELAYRMLVRKQAPSYGRLTDLGLTALPEALAFVMDLGERTAISFNHHFWGDIAALFIEYFAGIRPNPDGRDPDEVCVSPCFVPQIDTVSGSLRTPDGSVAVGWQRDGEAFVLTVRLTGAAHGVLLAPVGYRAEQGADRVPLESGTYRFLKAE